MTQDELIKTIACCIIDVADVNNYSNHHIVALKAHYDHGVRNDAPAVVELKPTVVEVAPAVVEVAPVLNDAVVTAMPDAPVVTV